MKTRTLIIIAAVAVLAASCGRISRYAKGIITYPTTPKEVAEQADLYNSDAALVVTKADTQYVLYRDRDHDGCYTMRYVSQHRCRHDFSARGQKFGIDQPGQPMVLKRTGDNSLTLSIDSLTIAVANINATDSTLTFRLGFDNGRLPSVLYLYDLDHNSTVQQPNNSTPIDLFAEPSIQQMLFIALSLDSLFTETDQQLAQAETDLEEAERELEIDEDEIEHVAQKGAYGENYAVYHQLDSLASVIGFANKECYRDDGHMIFKAWGGLGGSTNCYERMERMSAVANGKVAYSIHHKPNHNDCTFTARW